MKTANKNAGYYASNLIEFEGSNLKGKAEIINGQEAFAIYSYQTVMAINIDGLWFKNKTKYSTTTSKQMYHLKKSINFDFEIDGGNYGDNLENEVCNNLQFYVLKKTLPITNEKQPKKTKV